LVEERVKQIVSEREEEWRAKYAATSSSEPHSTLEVDQLKQRLAETERALQDAERRYQQEKRELLNLRTQQLKSETSKRGQEGDIIARAMQVMSEYEAIVRSSEENSLARLAHHMENFEKEWIARSREFEQRKAEFEQTVMAKALEVLQLHNGDVESIGHQIADKTLEMLRRQGESRLELEEQILQHSEQFKLQYKEMLEAEFFERCRLYDTKIAERERNLTKIIEAERERIIAAEQEAIKKHEATHVQALNDAMRDISSLREQLVHEHHEQQHQAMRELIARRNELKDEQQRIIDQANDHVHAIEQQCSDAIAVAQRNLHDMQLHMASREAELMKRITSLEMDKEKIRLDQLASVREEVELQWRAAMEEMRSVHVRELERLSLNFQEKIEQHRNQQQSREAELRKSYESKMIEVEESADARWASRVEEGNRALERHLEVIQALRADNEQLLAQITTLQHQFALREQELGSKVHQMQREQELVWQRKMEEMRIRYDQLLDEALDGHGNAATQADYEAAVAQVRELEERCVELKKNENRRLQNERDQLNELWRNRLEEERAERAVWEQDQLKRFSDMRIELQADARRKETELLRRAEQERLRYLEERTIQTAEERRDRDAFEERVRMEAETRIREAEEELNNAYIEKVRLLERRVEEKEVQLEKRRLDMKREQSKVEDEYKQQAAAWLEAEKKEILGDVKKFHEKLVEEQQQMDMDRSLFEQNISLEYARKFESAKEHLSHHITTVMNEQIKYWSACEDEWLSFRMSEVKMLFDQRAQHERLTLNHAAFVAQRAKEEAQTLLAEERRRLDEKEAKLYLTMEQERMACEAAARERALDLLDERNRLQEEAERQRAIEEAKLWEQLEHRVLEKERQAEAERRVIEIDLRNRYEALMRSERKRVDELMEQHRAEARELYDKQVQSLHQRDEEWHRRRQQIELEERRTYEEQYEALREQSEQRIADERKRFETAMRVREQEFDNERHRILDSMDKQLRDSEVETRQQLLNLKEDYDKRLRLIAQQSQQFREQYMDDIAEQEKRFQNSREDYEQEAMQHFQKSLKELRTTLEKRAKEQQLKDIEARETLEKQRREYEQKLNRQYEQLLNDQQEQLLRIQEEKEKKVLELEKLHQEHLLGVRRDMEKALGTYFSEADSRSREIAEATRKQFQGKLEEYFELVSQERRKRIELESQLSQTVDENENLKHSLEHEKLEIHRSIQAKFESLFAELREKTRREKEEQSKRLLEEEERKLAQEILRRDSERVKEVKDDVARAWTSSPAPGSRDRSMSGMPSAILQSTPAAPTTYSAIAAQRERMNKSDTTPLLRQASVPGLNSSQPPLPSYPAADDKGLSEQGDLMKRRREKLQQLWQVLDHPLDQRNAFLDQLYDQPQSTMLEKMSAEIRKLENQLPLLEVITRREFVLHRIRDLEKQTGKQSQIEEFEKERDRLTSYLRAEVPKFEQKHGHMFIFRGQRFLDSLQ
jgi:hypothetical protein